MVMEAIYDLAHETESTHSVLFAQRMHSLHCGAALCGRHWREGRGHLALLLRHLSDWRISVWWHNAFIFSSPYCASYITCGCWSPSRQSSMLTAKHDGTVHLWDLLVQKRRLRQRQQSTLETETKQKAADEKELRSADVQPHNAENSPTTQRTTR